MRLWLLTLLIFKARADPAADQLYEDLLYYYNRNCMPVKNSTDIMDVGFGAWLIRLINVDEIGQILTTNLWLEMRWKDHKLVWNPKDYHDIEKLHVPADQIWTPDIVLYNNADGNPDITILADATAYYDGTVIWKPPAIYNSFCEINIEYFPYDTQNCDMKFGGWTYNGDVVNIYQLPVNPGDVVETRYDSDGKSFQYLNPGMDISYFYLSAEWDLMNVTSERHELIYPGCCGQDMYIDITFKLQLRRKPLFFTVNLVIPCLLIAVLTTVVFYIPSSDHKITFSISILVTLTFNFLVLIDLIPPSNLVIPLMGKYLLFTMFLVGISTFVSVATLNLFHRNASTHRMPNWIRWLFLEVLPRPLLIKPRDPKPKEEEESTVSSDDSMLLRYLQGGGSRRPSPYFMSISQYEDTQQRLSHLAQQRGLHPDLVRRMIDNVSFIAEHFRALEDEDMISEEWSYVAMVIDRLFLIIFTVVNIVGTMLIILQAPSLFDSAMPMERPEMNEPLGGDTRNASDWLLVNNNLTL